MPSDLSISSISRMPYLFLLPIVLVFLRKKRSTLIPKFWSFFCKCRKTFCADLTFFWLCQYPFWIQEFRLFWSCADSIFSLLPCWGFSPRTDERWDRVRREQAKWANKQEAKSPPPPPHGGLFIRRRRWLFILIPLVGSNITRRSLEFTNRSLD